MEGFTRQDFIRRCTAPNGSFQIDLLRPYIDKAGVSLVCSRQTEEQADFTKLEWQTLDRAARSQWRSSLQFASLLIKSGLEMQSGQRAAFLSILTPLPLTHSHPFMPDVGEVRTGASMECGAHGRKVAEAIERMTLADLLGSSTASRMSMTKEDDGTWLVHGVLEAKRALQEKWFFGPYMVLYPAIVGFDDALDRILDPGVTARNAIKGIDGIIDVKGMDRMEKSVFVLLQMTIDVVRWVCAMEPTVIKWGPQDYRVVACATVEMRANANNDMGVCIIE
jgi:hypothetical protein